jgi:hypothetical protein
LLSTITCTLENTVVHHANTSPSKISSSRYVITQSIWLHTTTNLINDTQLIKKGKPTGDGECPPEIDRAFEIEERIDNRAGTCDINDSELDAGVISEAEGNRSEPISISSEDQAKVIATIRKGGSKGRAPQPTSGLALIKKLADSLEPSARTGQHVSTVQILTLHQELRDTQQQLRETQKLNESLRTELYKVQRRLDTAKIRWEVMGMSTADNCYPGKPDKRRTRRVTNVHGDDGEILHLTDTDTLASDDPSKENHRRHRRLRRTHPVRVKLESPVRMPLQDLPIIISDTDSDLPPPSAAFTRAD